MDTIAVAHYEADQAERWDRFVMEHAANAQLAREDYFVAADYGNQVVVFENGTRYVLMAKDGTQLLPSYQIVRYDHIGQLRYVHTGVLNLPDGLAGT